MKVTQCAIMLWSALLAALAASSGGQAAINNGFDTSLIYATQEPSFATTGATSSNGKISTFRKSDGQYIGDLMPIRTNYQYLAFAGGGSNDARLYAVKDYYPNGTANPATDIQIDEINASGQVINSKLLGANILGQAQLSTNVLSGIVRYDPFHNSLLIGAEENWSSGADNGKIYEVNLNLTALNHTYIGPNSWAEEGMGVDTDRAGHLFMTGHSLGSASDNNQGSVVMFDTTTRVLGGTTNAYSTLINGVTEPLNGPNAVIFRDSRNPTGQNALVILQQVASNSRQELEYYLNQTNPGNGNLQQVGPLYSSTSLAWSGMQDPVTGDVYIAHARTSIRIQRTNDTFALTSLGFSGQNRWYDVATPVPEPAAVVLLGLGGVWVGARRCGRQVG